MISYRASLARAAVALTVAIAGLLGLSGPAAASPVPRINAAAVDDCGNVGASFGGLININAANCLTLL